MRVAVACDHAGFPLKDEVIQAVREAGHEPIDLGVDAPQPPVDYPDIAEKACQEVLGGRAERAILICGSGVGVSIAANKIKGIYASMCNDVYSAHQGVEHDNMNVLCLGGRVIGGAIARELVCAFLNAKFSTEERHRRRVAKTRAIEARGE
jgi:ribose 5-phosphate isomerase B